MNHVLVLRLYKSLRVSLRSEIARTLSMEYSPLPPSVHKHDIIILCR